MNFRRHDDSLANNTVITDNSPDNHLNPRQYLRIFPTIPEGSRRRLEAHRRLPSIAGLANFLGNL